MERIYSLYKGDVPSSVITGFSQKLEFLRIKKNYFRGWRDCVGFVRMNSLLSVDEFNFYLAYVRE